jgi:hypothetical protein
LPNRAFGSRSRPTPPGFRQIVLCRPDAWVRVSFAHTRVSIVGWIYDPEPLQIPWKRFAGPALTPGRVQGTESRLTAKRAEDLKQVLRIPRGSFAPPLD